LATPYVRAEGPSTICYDNVAEQQQLAQIESDGQSSDRAECKEKLAEMNRREARKSELRSAIAAVNLEIERGAAAHFQTCSPVQDEIRKIDRDETNALVAGSQLDVSLVNRRKELRILIDNANIGLEAVATRCKQKLGLLEEELFDSSLNTTARVKLEADLVNKFGDKKKLARVRALQDLQGLLKPLVNNLSSICDENLNSVDIARQEGSEFLQQAVSQLDRVNLKFKILEGVSSSLFHEANSILKQIKEE
jgi:hypothetical protein